jgi:hypothetical protein
VIVVALVGLWFLSRITPRGVVLLISAMLYVAGIALTFGESRIMQGASGILKLTGFAGAILGVIDLVKRREGTSSRGTNDVSVLQGSLGVRTKPTNKTK